MAAHWEQIEEDAPQGGIVAPALLELRARVEALEAARTPNPTPPPVRGVTAEELARILVAGTETIRFADTSLCAAEELLNHPRLGPLLRGEGQAKRVELPEEPPVWLMPPGSRRPERGALVRYTWTAARAEVARQQGEG